jgi:O-antigen ligase
MSIIFGISWVSAIFSFIKIILKDLRKGMLFALIFCTFVPLAIPTKIIGVGGFVILLQAFIVLISITYVLWKQSNSNQKDFFIKDQGSVFAFTLLFLLWLLVLVFSFINFGNDYGFQKSIIFLIRSIIPVFTLILFSPFTEEDIIGVFYTILVGSLVTAVSIFTFGDISLERSVGGAEAGPIALARTLGLGATLCLISLLSGIKTGSKNFFLILVLLLTLVVSMFFTGSRGPLLSMLLAAGSYYLFLQSGAISRLKSTIRVIFFVTSVIALQLYFPVENIEINSVGRLFGYLESIGTNSSDVGRVSRIEVAIDGIQKSYFLGVGTGGYSTLYGGLEDDYPHNIILEFAVEQGIFGLGLLFWIFLLTFRRMLFLVQLYKNQTAVLSILSLVFYSFFNSLVSGDIALNQIFWLSIGLVWSVGAIKSYPSIVKVYRS